MAGIDDRHHPDRVKPLGDFAHRNVITAPSGQPMASILLDQNALPAKDLVHALGEARRLDVPLAHVLHSEGLAQSDDILLAQATELGVRLLQRDITPPDAACASLLTPEFCLTHRVLPWIFDQGQVVLATSRPEEFEDMTAALPADFPDFRMALCAEGDIHAEISTRHSAYLAKRAETSAPADSSCRDIGTKSAPMQITGAIASLTMCSLLAIFPNYIFAAGLALAVLSLLVLHALRIAAWIASSYARPALPQRLAPIELPSITLIVALYKEADIAETLLTRLAQLDYPRSRLEILLVLEEDDIRTKTVLGKTALPHWIKTVEVPLGAIQTKPRALNYALQRASGDIIGVYDAEDAPATDQLQKVAAQFAESSDNTACLQGILDFYNPKSNWLARCFTIEYATWFRVMLPGLARMGLVVPLGGTTVFFRRVALEKAGGWDAHNVTEDAELGVRLARMGYRTDILSSVTREEANNQIWPWIRQRSRWLKGYALTWWCHTRRPAALMRDLGIRKFFGFQVLFLATLTQFFLMPLLWSFWVFAFGLPHPAQPLLSAQVLFWIMGVMLCSEAVSLFIFHAGVARSPHRSLGLYILTLFAYFPLATIALYKALIEVVRKPFYWDKTQHGLSGPDAENCGSRPENNQPTS